MPCIFCIAALSLAVGTVTKAAVDRMEGQLAALPEAVVERATDTDSTALFKVAFGRRAVPVAVTVHKRQRRVRIQVQTHDVDTAEARRIERLIADALGAEIVELVAAPPGHEHASAPAPKPTRRLMPARAATPAVRRPRRGRSAM